MKTVVQIIKQLENTSGNNDKIQIIKDNATNANLVKVFQYTYSDDKMYGFSNKKLRENLDEFFKQKLKQNTKWTNGFDMCDELAKSNINNDLRNEVYKFLSICDEDEREIWIRVLTKDLRCRANAKLINKAIPNCIFIWEVQKGISVNKVKLKGNEWIAVSLKENGIRTTNFKSQFKSRQNKIQNGFKHIQDDLDKLGLPNMVFDGELIRNNIDNVSDNENFRLTSSIVNSDDSNKLPIQMVIFDLLPEDEFIKGESKLTFKDRLIQLQNIQKKIDELKLINITTAPIFYVGNDHSKIKEILQQVDSQGYEGIMVSLDKPYKCKRNTSLLKCKVFLEGDFKIIGFNRGEGKFENTLGSLQVEFKGNTVGVNGFSDEMRDEFWNNQDKYIGKIITVKYKEESKDEDTGLPSLQFPNFVTLRLDKDEANY